MYDEEYEIDDIILDEDDVPAQPKPVVKPTVPEQQPVQKPVEPELNLDPTANLLATRTNKNMYDEIERQEREIGEAPIDFSRLNDPTYTPFVERFMKLKRRKSNMMTLEEFNRYRPIFDPNSPLSAEDKQNLFIAWQHRVSLRDPVEVYDRGERVLIVPPAVADVKSISQVGHNVASGILDGFYNANELDFDMNGRREHWGSKLIQAFRYSQSDADLEEQSRRAELLAKQALGAPEDIPEETPQPSNVSNNNNVPSHTQTEDDDELVDDEYL